MQSGGHSGFASKESVAITLFTTCDLAIECLGVRAIESLDVRVATMVLRMMKRKKVATSRFSNFDTSFLILLAMLHRMVFASFSRSSCIDQKSLRASA